MNPFIFLRLNPLSDKLPVELCVIVISACTESQEILHITLFFLRSTCVFLGINSQNNSILRSPKFVCIVSDYTPYPSSSSPYHFESSNSFPTNTETILISLSSSSSYILCGFNPSSYGSNSVVDASTTLLSLITNTSMTVPIAEKS